MELILYITGGIALLALAWLLILIAKTIGKIQPVVTELLVDLRTIVVTPITKRTSVRGLSRNVRPG